jgi:uncharacterized membrane protein YdjX (TVP38/TMEM64 family)
MKKIKLSTIIYFALAAVFLAVMAVLTIKFAPAVTRLVEDREEFGRFIDSYGSLSILVFMGFQVLQVVIAAIPGEFVQIAGGYIFGTLAGTLYSTAGILVGALIAFFTARLLGSRIINVLVPEKSIEKFRFIINNTKAEIVIFLIFLIPGLPKDILVYIAGLSPIRPLRFFILFLVARMPRLLGSSLIGATLQQENYVLSIAIFAVSCLLFLAGVLSKDYIMGKLKTRSSKETQA